MTSAARLKDLLARPEIVRAPGAPDSLTARLVERAGFPAVYMTGFGATASRLGTPDIGLLTQTEMTEHARNMVRAVSIPVIADADTGYGGPSNIHRTVREYVQADVAALHLEDQVAPKRCGQMAGIRLMQREEAALRLEAAIEARGEDELVIIGRTDALPALGAAEAIERAKRYRDAGVDLVFVDGIKKIAEVEAVAKAAGPQVVETRLRRLQASWPRVAARLQQSLPAAATVRRWLEAAGAPSSPAAIGISAIKHARDYKRARLIRRRFTGLDVLHELGWLDAAVSDLFGANGFWRGSRAVA